ncbi:hypothetical protein ACFSHQ_26570 [Gemmobacter lanyuensis]
MHHEGVGRIVLMSDHPELFRASDLAPGTTIRHRDEIDAVMLELREEPGSAFWSMSRPAPPKSAAAASVGRWRTHPAALDQSGGLRRLRRLFGAIELRSGGTA